MCSVEHPGENVLGVLESREKVLEFFLSKRVGTLWLDDYKERTEMCHCRSMYVDCWQRITMHTDGLFMNWLILVKWTQYFDWSTQCLYIWNCCEFVVLAHVVEKPTVAAAFIEPEQNAHWWCSATTSNVRSSDGAAFIGCTCTCAATAGNDIIICPTGCVSGRTASWQCCCTTADSCRNSRRFCRDCTKDCTHYTANLASFCCMHQYLYSRDAVSNGSFCRRTLCITFVCIVTARNPQLVHICFKFSIHTRGDQKILQLRYKN